MGAVRLVFGAELRRRWRSWLILVVLIALVAGLVLAATAAGRRTATAFPRFVASHGYDVYIYNQKPVPGLSRLPGVSSVTTIDNPASGQPTCACTTHAISPSNFYINELSPTALRRVVKLVAGQMPAESSPYDVLASFTLQQDYGVHIGSVIHAPLYASSQLPALGSGANVAPSGPKVALHVVGIGAAEMEFPSGTTPEYDLFTTPAFARAVNKRVPHASVYLVRLRPGTSSLPRFAAAAGSLHLVYVSNQATAACGGNGIDPPPGRGLVGARRTGRACRPCRHRPGARSAERRRERGVPLFGGLGLAQAPARGARHGAESDGGFRRRGRRHHRRLCPVSSDAGRRGAPGRAFDRSCLRSAGPPPRSAGNGGGGSAPGIWPAVRASRVHIGGERASEGHPSIIVSKVVAAGAPPSAVIGVRHALERGRGAASLPVGTALFGSALAVMALCATVVFADSLTHLTTTPALYGSDYSVLVLDLERGAGQPHLLGVQPGARPLHHRHHAGGHR